MFIISIHNEKFQDKRPADQSIWPQASNQINQRQFNSWCCIYSLSLQSLATPVSLARTLLCFYFFSGTFVQIKFSNCIWNMDSRSMALSQTIYMFHRVRMIYTERAPSSLLLLSFEIRWEKEEKSAHTQLVLSWFIRNNLLYFVLCSGKRFWKTIYCWVVSFFCLLLYSLAVFLSFFLHFHCVRACVCVCLCAVPHWCAGVLELVSMSASVLVWARGG